ncbi:uncharacterized protein LOC128214423 [Mya arenaria]|uniref:uncharacterized protein LOC128214423 n=1 Tax=Mya arenaria TaxID=6604 RepID=UPI0022E6F6D1|nr:uncharacterized protein LOC128214423 [Mya arenaria]
MLASRIQKGNLPRLRPNQCPCHQQKILRRKATPEQIADPNFMLMEIQKDVGIKQDYPAMGYLMLVGALITTSTVVVERVFSLMNRLCTPLRASMSQKTIEELMRVVSIGEECLTDEQLNEAIAYFGRKKDRMVKF